MDTYENAADVENSLNETSAFSVYWWAIDRISEQYDIWQGKQGELEAFYKQYEVASNLAKLHCQTTLQLDNISQEIKANSVYLTKSQLAIDEGVKLIEVLKSTQHRQSEDYESWTVQLDELNESFVKKRKKVQSIELKIERSAFCAQAISVLFVLFLALIFCSILTFFYSSFLYIFILCTVVIGIFIDYLVSNKYILRLLAPLKVLHEPLCAIFLAMNGHDNSFNLKELISERNRITLMIAEIQSKLDLHPSTCTAELLPIKQKILGKLQQVAASIPHAEHAAQTIAPLEFTAESDAQKINLGQALQYWESEPATHTPRLLARPWQDNAWDHQYQPTFDSHLPDCIRLGNFWIENLDPTTNKPLPPLEIPAMLPIRAIRDTIGNRFPGHIVIFSDIQTRTLALQFLETLALRLLATFPVRSLKGSFIDPVALGDTFPFKGLPKSILSGQQIFTRNQDIREELKTLVTHVEQVIQNYLGRNYQTLEDYNSDSSAIPEAYRYLFIADFPTAFDSHTAEELKSLITNGSRAGVYTIIHVDTSKEALRGFDYNLFNQYCTVIRPTQETHNNQPVFQLQMPNGWQRQLTLDRPPSQDIHQKIITSLCDIEKTVKVETVPFSSLYPQHLWQSTSEQELRAPIGTAGAREQIEFWLGENNEKLTVSSGLLAGKPGAGKSYTLHATILSLAMQYSPDELELYLLDFKEGVEFQVYVDPTRWGSTTTELDETRALPHAKVISIESDREFGLSVLQSVQRKIETRAQSFKEVGVSELKDYRAKTNKPEPRILVIIDEFQYMFQDNDTITRELNQIIEDITRRGRSFGVHLLLASQSLRIANIQSSIYTYMPLRMAMQMDQSTAAIVLEEGNLDAIELLDRSGRIIYNTEFGRKRQNQLGQIADISLEERHKAMAQIHQQAESEFYQRSQPAIVFQGNRPSKVSQNGQILALKRMNQWLSSSALNKQIIQNPDWLAPEIPSALWLGEAMRIGHHTSAILRRRTRSNLLLVGQSESNIFGMLGGALISLVHIHKPQSAEFHIIDLSQTDDDEALSEMTSHFQQFFQSLYPIQIGKRFPESDRNIKRAEKILETIYEELQRRKELRSAQPDTMDFGPSVFFVAAIGSLNRAQYLRPVAGRRGDEMSPDAQKLQEIVTLGPELGIQTLLWVDNAKTFQQLCGETSPRTLLMQFDNRAVLQLPADDSRFFLGEPIAEKLPTLRGYYYDASTSEGFEKFKPYSVLAPSDIQQYAQALTQRSI